MKKEILVWQCPKCKDIMCSNNWTRHQMDYCKCGESACDMEEHYTRFAGVSPESIKSKHFEVEKLLNDK